MSASRREFLRMLAAALGAGAATPLASTLEALAAGTSKKAKAAKASGKSGRYRLGQWTGDDFALGHRLRNRDFPLPWPTKAEKEVDFVIVGGGIAGLASAYYLRDHDFLLLEQYAGLGGQSRGGSYRGIDYSWGPAYVDSVEGIYGELFSELGLTPVTITPQEKYAWFWDGHWAPGVEGSAKNKSGIYSQWKNLLADVKPLLKTVSIDDAPENVTADALVKLDNGRFADLVKGTDKQFLSMLDAYCKSNLCGNLEQLSALAGVWLLTALATPAYVFKGGNPALGRALASRVEKAGSERCQTGAFVWRVEIGDKKASVIYSGSDGVIHRVDCKHVIVTAPPLVATRIMSGLSDKIRAELLFMKYGSYLVANLLMKKKLFDGLYDNWVGSPFSFADVIAAETPYQKSGAYKASMGSVLTVYQPYEPGSAGRSLLMMGNRQEFAASVGDQVARLVDHLYEHLEEVVLTRWGHAMAVTGPGYYGRLNRILAAQDGPYTLAHNSMQGLPCAESAIRAARLAARRALGKS